MQSHELCPVLIERVKCVEGSAEEEVQMAACECPYCSAGKTSQATEAPGVGYSIKC